MIAPIKGDRNAKKDRTAGLASGFITWNLMIIRLLTCSDGEGHSPLWYMIRAGNPGHYRNKCETTATILSASGVPTVMALSFLSRGRTFASIMLGHSELHFFAGAGRLSLDQGINGHDPPVL